MDSALKALHASLVQPLAYIVFKTDAIHQISESDYKLKERDIRSLSVGPIRTLPSDRMQ